jgi:hypothetical protein
MRLPYIRQANAWTTYIRQQAADGETQGNPNKRKGPLGKKLFTSWEIGHLQTSFDELLARRPKKTPPPLAIFK